jgi:hypothetical protein
MKFLMPAQVICPYPDHLTVLSPRPAARAIAQNTVYRIRAGEMKIHAQCRLCDIIELVASYR